MIDVTAIQHDNICGCRLLHPLRQKVRKLVHSPDFEHTILFFILVNVVVMTLESPLDTPAEDAVQEQIAFACTCVFTAEMALKLAAHRFCEYAADGWNLLDAFVVTTAWVEILVPDAGNYSALRAMRVLRALRAIGTVPSLRRIMKTLLGSVPRLKHVMMLTGLFLLLMAVVGLTFFCGDFHRRCAEAGAEEADGAACTRDAHCGPTEVCVAVADNPEEGTVSFDDAPHALMSVFQALSLEGWVDQMYMLQATDPVAATAFYVLLVRAVCGTRRRIAALLATAASC